MDLIKKAYICNKCKHKGVILNAIKKNDVISTDFLREYVKPLGEITESKIYKYNVIRDDCDIVVAKEPFECACEKCGSSIRYLPTQKFDNVLNYYPICENEKWLRGFEGLGQGR